LLGIKIFIYHYCFSGIITFRSHNRTLMAGVILETLLNLLAFELAIFGPLSCSYSLHAIRVSFSRSFIMACIQIIYYVVSKYFPRNQN